MANSQLNLIRKYCDTTGIRLSGADKNLLCKVLENPEKYNGFESPEYRDIHPGRDYRDTYISTTKWQYRLKIDDSLSIYEKYYHECDGYAQTEHWNWKNAYHITETRRIIKILREIESCL